MKLSIKKHLNNYWNFIKENPITSFFNTIIFISSVATIVAVIIGLPQIRLANDQLKELNSKAEISIKLHLASSILSYGPKYTEPFDIKLIPRNIGNYDTNSWVVSVIFCQNTHINSADMNWINVDSGNKIYVLKSNSIVTKDQAMFSDDIDSVGKFTISIPRNDNTVPIAFIHTSGQRTQIHQELVSFDWKNISDPIQYDPKASFLTSSSTCVTVSDKSEK